MDTSDPVTLKELFTKDIPPAFLKNLYERVAQIYPDSFEAMTNDPSLGEEQANYAMGYYRRALAETVLMRTAAEHGLEVKELKPDNGGCKCVFIKVGRFGFTMCHVTSSGGFPKSSDVREQSSRINELAAQGQLFPMPDNPNKEDIYGIIVHTEQSKNKKEFHSLHIGIPKPEFDDWIEEPINILDIIDIQARLFQPEEDLQAVIQNPKPVWKKLDQSKNKEGA